jgi:hypothetical protein
MSSEVEFWQFNADGETLDADNETGHLLKDFVVVIFNAPLPGNEYTEDIRTKEDAEKDCERWFWSVLEMYKILRV